MISDPVQDVMTDRLEEEIRNRLLARWEWNVVQVCYRGEPGMVPVRLYPFGVVFMTNEGEARGEDGYTDDTGPMRSRRYDGFITVEVLVPDTSSLVPDENRKADIPSYQQSKRLIQAAKQMLMLWGRQMMDDPNAITTSADGRERISSLRIDQVQNALSVRPNETVANTSTIPFHIFTRRSEQEEIIP